MSSGVSTYMYETKKNLCTGIINFTSSDARSLFESSTKLCTV